MQTIFVQLEEEGTAVYRPVAARPIGEGRFELVAPEGETSAEGEVWQFPLGAKVKAEMRQIGNEQVLVAVSTL